MIRFDVLIRALADEGVESIIVGGFAATLLGSSRMTRDLDIVVRRTPENFDRLVRALTPFEPYLRGAPPGLPFTFDARTLDRGLNFTLTSKVGDLDLFGEIAGGGNFEALLPHARPTEIYDRTCFVLSLEKLIEVKRAAGRPKDLDAVAELEIIREERDRI